MRISEIFESIQGEVLVGHPAIFLRLQGCCLNCQFCDTKEIMNKGENVSVDNLYKLFQERNYIEKLYNQKRRLIITGGSPLLQQTEISEFLKKTSSYSPKWKNDYFCVDFENECVIELTDKFIDSLLYYPVFFSNSIKLSNSGIDIEKRIKEEPIKQMADLIEEGKNIKGCFKFVVSTKEHVQEANDIVEQFKIDNSIVYLMPEGKTREEIIGKSNDVVEWCKEFGYCFSPREHIIIWNLQRYK